MLRRSHLLVLACTVLSLTACGGGKKSGAGGGGKVASCNMPGAQTCREYRGGNLAMGTDMLAKLCDPAISASAKFSETACPTDKLIGTCAKDEGKDFFYEGYAIPAADNEKDCKDRGGTYAAK